MVLLALAMISGARRWIAFFAPAPIVGANWRDVTGKLPWRAKYVACYP